MLHAVLALVPVGAVVQLVEYRTRNREVASSTHTRSTASNLEQANLRALILHRRRRFINHLLTYLLTYLLCAQANSASYPQRDGK